MVIQSHEHFMMIKSRWSSTDNQILLQCSLDVYQLIIISTFYFWCLWEGERSFPPSASWMGRTTPSRPILLLGSLLMWRRRRRRKISLRCFVIMVSMLCLIYTPHHRQKWGIQCMELELFNPSILVANTAMILDLDMWSRSSTNLKDLKDQPFTRSAT